ncbi:RING finger protein 151 [Plecturocebus cupreus]
MPKAPKSSSRLGGTVGEKKVAVLVIPLKPWSWGNSSMKLGSDPGLLRISCQLPSSPRALLTYPRQKTCPCCRKQVKRRKIVHENKLWKTISRLEVKCKNADAGCTVTCPLAHRRGHQDSCPFEPMACPNEGCTFQVPRGALAEHRKHCQQRAQQHCPMGCGATLDPTKHAHHNCYRELHNTWSARQERSRTLLLSLLRRVRRLHRATSIVRRELAELGNFLEEDTALLEGTRQEEAEAEAAPEGSFGAEVGGAQGQDTL